MNTLYYYRTTVTVSPWPFAACNKIVIAIGILNAFISGRPLSVPVSVCSHGYSPDLQPLWINIHDNLVPVEEDEEKWCLWICRREKWWSQMPFPSNLCKCHNHWHCCNWAEKCNEGVHVELDTYNTTSSYSPSTLSDSVWPYALPHIIILLPLSPPFHLTIHSDVPLLQSFSVRHQAEKTVWQQIIILSGGSGGTLDECQPTR